MLSFLLKQLAAAQNEEAPAKKSVLQKMKSGVDSIKQRMTGNKKEDASESKKDSVKGRSHEPKKEPKTKAPAPPAMHEERKLVVEMMNPMMQMVDWEKSQLGI